LLTYSDDHLDKRTIVDIEKYHSGVQYFVPMGIKRILMKFGVSPYQVQELGWWEESTINTDIVKQDHDNHQYQLDINIPTSTFNLNRKEPPLSPTSTLFSKDTLLNEPKIVVTCCPAQHNSGRGLLNRNSTLWASWYLTSYLPDGQTFKLYFGGYVKSPYLYS
jgi:L-ascorbate metabolism protein UlaG (beta-lactamase superfamily)